MSIRINVSRVIASLKLGILLYQRATFTNQSKTMKNKKKLILEILSFFFKVAVNGVHFFKLTYPL